MMKQETGDWGQTKRGGIWEKLRGKKKRNWACHLLRVHWVPPLLFSLVLRSLWCYVCALLQVMPPLTPAYESHVLWRHNLRSYKHCFTVIPGRSFSDSEKKGNSYKLEKRGNHPGRFCYGRALSLVLVDTYWLLVIWRANTTPTVKWKVDTKPSLNYTYSFSSCVGKKDLFYQSEG